MKKTYKILAFLLLIIITGCSSTSKVDKDDTLKNLREYSNSELIGPKRRIVVGKVKNNTQYGSARLGDIATDVLQSELSNTDRFIILERADLDSVLEETNFSSTLGQDSIAGKQQFLDAEYVIVGAVTKYGVNVKGNDAFVSKSKEQRAEVVIDVKMINVLTGDVFIATGEGVASIKYKSVLGIGSSGGYDESIEQNAFRAATINAMENIVKSIDSIPWSAKVIKVSGSKVYINAGKQSNLKLGKKVDIYAQGEKIEDNGKFIGFEERKLGEGKVESYIGSDGAIITVTDGKGEFPGVVRLK